MGREADQGINSPPSEASLFAQLLLGRPIPRLPRGDRDSQSSSDRRLLEWAAQFSARAAAKLQELQRLEAIEREAWRRVEQFHERHCVRLIEWSEADHPRHPEGTSAGGEFAPKGGGGGAGKAAASKPLASKASSAAVPSPDSSRWYLPASTKGEWVGEKGNSVFRLKTSVKVGDGKLIGEIEFRNGAPVLDRFALPGQTATIVLTGDHKADIANAERAWRKLNPGMDLPSNSTFHHDLLHATEQNVEIDGKKTKVLVGKMQLIPRTVNQAVYHEGTASVAKKFYQGLGIDASSIAKLARDEAHIAGESRAIVSRAAKRIRPGTIAKGIAPLVGRTILRAIPLVSSGLAVLEFAENAEAHGFGGAIARATPVLGDLIGAHDLGSELAKGIRDEADAAEGEAQVSGNEPSRKAWDEADAQTIAAFNELAPLIKVTNVPSSGDGKGLVDPDEITTALFHYRNAMQSANLKRNNGKNQVAFEAEAAQNKEELRRSLEDASQRRGPAPKGPLT